MATRKRDPLLQPHPDVVFREDAPESQDAGVLYHPANDRAFSLNSTGLQVWQLLSGGIRRSELIDRLSVQYAQLPPDAAEKVLRFVDRLQEYGLVRADA